VHVATLNNQDECVRLLILAGAKVNQFDNDGWTPLMAAAAFAEHKMVKMLLDAGANPTRRAQKGHHKGMNARDLVKDVQEQKGSMATKCLVLLEGVPCRYTYIYIQIRYRCIEPRTANSRRRAYC
jgi:ankyrin repeat protein